jgi:hypothetical protein
MSRVLSELLGAREPLFTQTIQELEQACDKPGVDIRLTAELDQSVQLKTRELGFDPSDSRGQEIYHGLQALTAVHDSFLAKACGITDPEYIEEVLHLIKAKVDNLDLPRSCWALKHSVARKLLKQMPPKKVMKHLGYRSVDSMLKREHIAELFSALRFAESAQWLERFIRSYKKLGPQDFESRDIELIVLAEAKWGSLAHEYVNHKRQNVTHLKELGVVALLPLPIKRLRGITLAVMLLTLHYIDEIRAYSAHFKLQQVKPNFATTLIKTLIYDPQNAVSLLGQPVHWRLVRKHFGRPEGTSYPEIFEPHVQLDDLRWQRSEETLYRIEPALKFWEKMDYVGVFQDGRAVSFNLMDNVVNYCNDVSYGEQVSYHLGNSIWNELTLRYMAEKNLEDAILSQLDTNDDLELQINLKGLLA